MAAILILIKSFMLDLLNFDISLRKNHVTGRGKPLLLVYCLGALEEKQDNISGL